MYKNINFSFRTPIHYKHLCLLKEWDRPNIRILYPQPELREKIRTKQTINISKLMGNICGQRRGIYYI